MNDSGTMINNRSSGRLHDAEVEFSPSIIERVAEGVVGRALDHAQASTVYGEARQQGDRTVIPVARVSARYGFGGGEQGSSAEKESESGGGGGGGAIDARPIGYIEITPVETRFVPIVDSSSIAIRAVTMAGICGMMLMFALLRRR